MVHFRDATDADLQLTFEIKKSSIRPAVEKIWGWDDDVQLNLHKTAFKPAQVKIVQNDHGEEIGLLSFTEDRTCLYLKSILICDFAQNRGVGTLILSDLIEKARSTNKRVELQVFKVNEPAKRLYERLGFRTIGQTDVHYQMVLDAG